MPFIGWIRHVGTVPPCAMAIPRSLWTTVSYNITYPVHFDPACQKNRHSFKNQAHYLHFPQKWNLSLIGHDCFCFFLLQGNISNFDLVMESDLGTFSPVGLQFTGSDKARAIMKEVMNLLAPINVTSLEEHGEGTDINMWMKAGVPGQFEWRVPFTTS